MEQKNIYLIQQITQTYMEVVSMNKVVKGIIIVAVLLYVVSPVDAYQGPVDDLFAIMMAMGVAKSKSIE